MTSLQSAPSASNFRGCTRLKFSYQRPGRFLTISLTSTYCRMRRRDRKTRSIYRNLPSTRSRRRAHHQRQLKEILYRARNFAPDVSCALFMVTHDLKKKLTSIHSVQTNRYSAEQVQHQKGLTSVS